MPGVKTAREKLHSGSRHQRGAPQQSARLAGMRLVRFAVGFVHVARVAQWTPEKHGYCLWRLNCPEYGLAIFLSVNKLTQQVVKLLAVHGSPRPRVLTARLIFLNFVTMRSVPAGCVVR